VHFAKLLYELPTAKFCRDVLNRCADDLLNSSRKQFLPAVLLGTSFFISPEKISASISNTAERYQGFLISNCRAYCAHAWIQLQRVGYLVVFIVV